MWEKVKTKAKNFGTKVCDVAEEAASYAIAGVGMTIGIGVTIIAGLVAYNALTDSNEKGEDDSDVTTEE